MNSDSIKWLFAGLAGALLTLCMMGAGAYMAFRYATELGLDDLATVSGPDEWAEEQEEYNAEQEELASEIERLDLNKVYKQVYLHDNTRNAVYSQKRFKEVGERLAAQFAAADTPLKKHRYSQHIRYIANLEYNEDPEAILAVLDDWVSRSPDIHFPWLIRGIFKHDYSFYFRGSGWSSEVTREGMENYHRLNAEGLEDLLHASELAPGDAEPFAGLIDAAAGSGEGYDRMRVYYDKALALNPHHLNARWTMMHYAQPRWFGDWEMMDKLVEDCEAASGEFPLLYRVIGMAASLMDDRGPEYKNKWGSPEMTRLRAEGSLAQLAQAPDDVHLLADAACNANYADDLETASALFMRLGNTYPVGSNVNSLLHFHEIRMHVLTNYKGGELLAGTPGEEEFLKLALATDHMSLPAVGAYLGYLVRQRDDARTAAYHKDLQNAYVMTGDWGDPIDYTVLDAMAKAARADDGGIRDTEEEKALLDEAVSLAPENPFVRLMYTEHHIRLDEFAEARVHLEKARELDPDYLPALHIMGWLNFHQKRWDEGIASAKAFLATAPSEYRTAFSDDAQEIITLCEKKKKAAAG